MDPIDAGRLREDLERLVRIPSVAFDGHPAEPLHEAAALVRDLLPGSRYVDVPGEAPSVYAEYGAAGDGPTVLLYAHYDVQPAPADGWESDPFEPTLRGTRLYGRGAADDKSGVVAHLAALRALDFTPPVHTKVLIEGSEENGRQRILEVVDAQPDLMRADVLVIADGGNWKLGEPTLCTTLRGHGKLTVTLRTLENALHSGQFGGAAPDALLALTRLLASLHDDAGDVAVDGLTDGAWDGADLPEADFRRQAGVLEGVGLVGSGSVGDRLWARHAISVLGLDAPPVEGAGNIVIPAARAKVAVRVPPGADPVASMQAVERHLRAHAPWEARLEIDVEPASSPLALAADAAAAAALETAYGKPVAVMGSGGSIPLVARLADVYPEAKIVLWGAQDSDAAQIHAANESVDLAELEAIARTEALFLTQLARG
ncbi:acetylornithine deacetylase/succinyl-diaminopimelate desuccinylase-like protein [Solirubrobacter pauli]|uniref:Acetylornithine deacetylase/succinyl-diaminopimelate desuccinylase-like protein n=1 Tax=Solirubrobacter pauli TaxID=166793 RepID=A0A660L313_9ACTN|nr:M20/M25/M40 family metallo-hydrolase [Solirubrobacter pauli]RKQ87828.1 acetylornithine deacetylase/succinyl-diaminopimelate desuccinylase-like protein [Solirubrobacter pauli]